jgi:hypothetical protein
MPVFAHKNLAKNVGSEPILFIIRYVLACFNYLNHQSVAETILVMDNGSHCDAILNNLYFILSKNSRVLHNTVMQKEHMPVYFLT